MKTACCLETATSKNVGNGLKSPNGKCMEALLKTNNPAVLSFVEALLSEANIEYLVLDQHMSIVEGSLGIIPRRVLVHEIMLSRARQILMDADLGNELEPEA